jgi:hypothetical protein
LADLIQDSQFKVENPAWLYSYLPILTAKKWSKSLFICDDTDIVYSIISYQVVPEHGHCWDLFGQAAYKIYHAEQKYCALIGKNEHAIEEEQGMV